jgi:glycosyltransferase involved in cell wall biosynthesis
MKMKIAMLAPLAEAVPPALYGGTERVVSVLTEELVRRGHDVSLFASGDSQTSARLFACSPRALRISGDDLLPQAATMAQLAEVYGRASEFDLIHNHVDWLAFPFARLSSTPTLSTVHGRIDVPPVRNTYRRFPEQPLVAISAAQRAFLPGANWVATTYNGIALDHFAFRGSPGRYLVFLGRISPEKRPDRAIEIAGRAGMPLVIAAKVDPADRDYYQEQIAPVIRRSPWVRFVGEVDERAKDELLGNAYACLFPIDWPEPFGLTMVEAMATGTPVIAWRGGSVPEVVRDGVTGFIRDTMDGMVRAVEEVGQLDRAACRAHVEQHFGPEVMVDGYEAAYQRLLAAQTAERRMVSDHSGLALVRVVDRSAQTPARPARPA